MKKKALEKALCTVAVISLAVCYWTKATGTEVVEVEGGIYYNIRDEPEEITGELIPVDVVPETTDASILVFRIAQWIQQESLLTLFWNLH